MSRDSGREEGSWDARTEEGESVCLEYLRFRSLASAPRPTPTPCRAAVRFLQPACDYFDIRLDDIYLGPAV